MTLQTSDFTKFRQGYEAGYHGKEAECPENAHYMSGYDEGCEDDRFDMPDRYGMASIERDISPVHIEELQK
jgi:hypothetical protein